MNQKGLEAVELMAKGARSRFLVGDAPTIADLCLVPQLYSVRRFGVDTAAFPTLLRIEASCVELESFRGAPRPSARRPQAAVKELLLAQPIGIRRIEFLYYVHDLERVRRLFADQLDFAEAA